ncbi:MAG: hypothetical protein WC058_01280 [Phycisphaeraceae bacterium]
MKTRTRKMGLGLLLLFVFHLVGCATIGVDPDDGPTGIDLTITSIKWEAQKPGGIEKGIPGWIAKGVLTNKSPSVYRFWSDRTDHTISPVRIPQHCVAFERLVSGIWKPVERMSEGAGVPDAIDPGTSTDVEIEVPRYLVQPGWEIQIVFDSNVRSNGVIVPVDGTPSSMQK